MNEEICNSLREIVETIAYICVSKNIDDQVVNTRIRNMLDRLDSLTYAMELCCGKACHDELRDFVEKRVFDDEAVDSIIMKIHNCMVNYGCRSNVSVIGQI